MRVRVKKGPWRFSRHGHDFNVANEGEQLEVTADGAAPSISERLAQEGQSTGHLEAVARKTKAHKRAPETK